MVKSAVNPEASLKKKHLSIVYHKCREFFAAGVVDIYFIHSEESLADLITKVLPMVKRKINIQLYIRKSNYYIQIYINPYSMCRCNLELILLIITRSQRGD